MGTALIPFEPGSRHPASADTRAKPTGFAYSELRSCTRLNPLLRLGLCDEPS
jgi:hypothetical protein